MATSSAPATHGRCQDPTLAIRLPILESLQRRRVPFCHHNCAGCTPARSTSLGSLHLLTRSFSREGSTMASDIRKGRTASCADSGCDLLLIDISGFEVHGCHCASRPYLVPLPNPWRLEPDQSRGRGAFSSVDRWRFFQPSPSALTFAWNHHSRLPAALLAHLEVNVSEASLLAATYPLSIRFHSLGSMLFRAATRSEAPGRIERYSLPIPVLFILSALSMHRSKF